MGDLQTARRHFDQAMGIKSRQGRAAALPEFVAATDADASMADAWLGRIACGDSDLASLRHLYATSEWLHRETTRIGQMLAAEIQLGPYIGITVTDASQVGLALSSALTIACAGNSSAAASSTSGQRCVRYIKKVRASWCHW